MYNQPFRKIQAKEGVGKPCHYCKRNMLPYDNSDKVNPILAGKECSIDHIVPRALGGTDHTDNLVFSCRRCNSLRGHLDYTIFAMFGHVILREYPDAPTIFLRASLVQFITSLAEIAINNKRESKKAINFAKSKLVHDLKKAKGVF